MAAIRGIYMKKYTLLVCTLFATSAYLEAKHGRPESVESISSVDTFYLSDDSADSTPIGTPRVKDEGLEREMFRKKERKLRTLTEEEKATLGMVPTREESEHPKGEAGKVHRKRQLGMPKGWRPEDLPQGESEYMESAPRPRRATKKRQYLELPPAPEYREDW